MSRKALLLLVIFLSFCAPKTKPKYPKPPPGSREPPVTQPAEETPERMASSALIERGQEALEGGRHDQAADLFQEAVSVDPSNGVGYYYLALVKLRTGEYGEVWGLIEKAESLLGEEGEWPEKLETLKRELETLGPD